MIAITPIPAFEDNYFWLITLGDKAVIIDPGDATPVLAHLKQHQLDLVGILITHHHADHVGGLKQLKQNYGCPVWGPKYDSIADLDMCIEQGDQVNIPEIKLNLAVISVPGHTKGHIAYFLAESDLTPNALFCGDTLFSGGCGRLFEGTATQMWQSMQKIMLLPQNTLIFPAHEYTLSNLDFARQVEPDNQDLQHYQHEVKAKRNKGLPSLPTHLALEKKINPFLRVEQASIIKSAMSQQQHAKTPSNDEVFAIIRRWKDTF